MAISDGAPVNAAASNAAWMSRTSNTSTTGSITQSNSTSSTDKDTGAFVTNGGVGVEENINAGGTIKTADTTQSTDKDTGSIVTEGGVGIEKNLNVGGDGSFAGNLNAANLNGTNTGDVNLTAIGATPNANAASLTAQSLTLQPASSAFGGVVTTTTQSFSGNKTFDDNVTIDGDLTVNGTTTTVNSATLEVTDANVLVNNGGNDASAEGAGLQVERTGTNGNIAYANALASKWKVGSLGSESEVMTVGTAQVVSGVKTYTAAEIFQSILQGDQLVDASATGSNASVTATKFNVKVTNGSLVSIRDISSPASSQFFVLTNGTGAAISIVNDNTGSTRILTGTSADMIVAIDASVYLIYDTNSSRWRVVGGSGDLFNLTAIGSTPNANGSSYNTATGAFNLQPANGSFGGIVTTGVQTIAGNKTFSGTISASNLSGTNTGDVDLSTISGTLGIGKGGSGQTTANAALNSFLPSQAGNNGKVLQTDGTDTSWQTSSGSTVSLSAIGSTPNANAATLTGQVLNLEPASASFGGVVTTGTQTFAGAKTFSGAISASNLSGTNTGDVDLSTISGTLAIGKGGTGQTTNTLGFNALSPLTTKGDLVVRDATNNIRQAVGNDYYPLSGLSATTSGIGYLNTHSAYQLSNVSIDTTVGANALTVKVFTANGSNASTTNPIIVSFRSTPVNLTDVVLRSVTSSLSMVISSGSTLGQTSGQPSYIWVYLIDNAGTVEVAVSHKKYTEDSLVSTTAEGGAGAADSHTAIYSTTARTNVAIRLIGYFVNTQTTAGTWISNPNKAQVAPFDAKNGITVQAFGATTPVTYITPAGCILLKTYMAGAGGGGGGSGTANGTIGGTGGSTSFGTRTAGGGFGAQRLSGGANGSNSGSGYTVLKNINGQIGGGGGVNPTTANGSQCAGGAGGSSFYGMGGNAGSAGAGGGVAASYGGGGGGGGNDNIGASQSGGGGGSGGYIEFIISDPESSYTYSVGTAGAAGLAGTSGRVGGIGADGILVVEEFYY